MHSIRKRETLKDNGGSSVLTRMMVTVKRAAWLTIDWLCQAVGGTKIEYNDQLIHNL